MGANTTTSTYRNVVKKKPSAIRAMFNNVPHRYDFLNALHSFGQDRLWRQRLVRLAGAGRGMRVLDVCTGTGDLAIAFARAGCGPVIGLDFSTGMLRLAARKIPRRGERKVRLVTGDAFSLPFENAAFDVISVSFGIRNLVDMPRALSEMVRVLRSGGRLVILELAYPRGHLLSPVSRWYLSKVVPLIGRAVSGSTYAYSYLAESIARFPEPSAIAAFMRNAGCSEVSVEKIQFGSIVFYAGLKGGK